MGNKSLAVLVLALSLGLTGCSAEQTPSASPTPNQTPDATSTAEASPVPTEAPANLVIVDPGKFITSSGDLVFRVGDGPTWCTLTEAENVAVCEHTEADALYDPVPIPETCENAFGSQLRLLSKPVTGEQTAGFACVSSLYSDPSAAPVLASGESVTDFGFLCFVEEQSARCENSNGDYIALGPKAWAHSD
jgi:hypothetical protein